MLLIRNDSTCNKPLRDSSTSLNQPSIPSYSYKTLSEYLCYLRASTRSRSVFPIEEKVGIPWHFNDKNENNIKYYFEFPSEFKVKNPRKHIPLSNIYDTVYDDTSIVSSMSADSVPDYKGDDSLLSLMHKLDENKSQNYGVQDTAVAQMLIDLMQ